MNHEYVEVRVGRTTLCLSKGNRAVAGPVSKAQLKALPAVIFRVLS
jgi:hypothetical protein